MKKRSAILVAFILIIFAAAGIGYYQWNKPAERIEDQEAATIAAPALYAAFTANEQQANAAYLNKPLLVSGNIAEVSKNQDGKTVIVLDAGDLLGGVQCTLREAGVTPAAGQAVAIKGFCTGYTVVVLLNDCILQ